jgi:uncharacterized protein (DUF3820 family)
MSTDAFRAAAAHVLPFGKYSGKTIDKIAETDEGLRWLDWLRGEIETGRLHAGNEQMQTEIRKALRDYLDDPAIAGDLAKLVKG